MSLILRVNSSPVFAVYTPVDTLVRPVAVMLTSVTSGVSVEVLKSPSKIEQAVRVARSVATSTINIINFAKVSFFIVLFLFVLLIIQQFCGEFCQQ